MDGQRATSLEICDNQDLTSCPARGRVCPAKHLIGSIHLVDVDNSAGNVELLAQRVSRGLVPIAICPVELKFVRLKARYHEGRFAQ